MERLIKSTADLEAKPIENIGVQVSEENTVNTTVIDGEGHAAGAEVNTIEATAAKPAVISVPNPAASIPISADVATKIRKESAFMLKDATAKEESVGVPLLQEIASLRSPSKRQTNSALEKLSARRKMKKPPGDGSTDTVTFTVAAVAVMCAVLFVIFTFLQWRRTLLVIHASQVQSRQSLQDIREEVHRLISNASSLEEALPDLNQEMGYGSNIVLPSGPTPVKPPRSKQIMCKAKEISESLDRMEDDI